MILDKIVEAKKKYLDFKKRVVSLEMLVSEVNKLDYQKRDFKEAISKKDLSFICEIKKASPSKGDIVEDFNFNEIALEYFEGGADAISVLTEREFFKGDDEILLSVAKKIELPLLRKDFIIDEYQIYESKTLNASAILLICVILDYQKLKRFIKLAHSLNLSVLVETRNKEEITNAIDCGAQIIGVNNRDLKTFKVDKNISINLRKFVPSDILFVSESGIEAYEDIKILKEAKVDAVLIGETLMRSKNKKETLNKIRYGY